jgi:hypothetical protein
MVAKLIRLTHKIATKLPLVAESYTIRSSRSRWPVRQLLDTSSYIVKLSGIGGSRDSSVGIATRLRDGRPRFDSRQRLGIFLFTTASRPALGSTQPTIQWIGGYFPGIRRPGRETDNSPPSKSKIILHRSSPSLPHTSSWCGA